MAFPETISAAEYLARNPERDHRGEPDRATAAQYNGTQGKSWDRPLTGEELTEEVHNFMPRVIKAFQANGCELQYHTTDPRKCRQGFPDLVISHDGLLVVAELKVTDSRGKPKPPEPEQRKWLDGFADCDVEGTFLWYPSDWDTICQIARGEMGRYAVGWYELPSRWVNRRQVKP